MHILISIIRDFKNFFSLKNNKGKIRTVITLILILTAIITVVINSNETSEEATNNPRQVTVGTISSLPGSNNFSLVGKVESVDQAKIQTETAGQVTNVYVTLGQELRAGQIIAELENRSQYASLLQAQGAYEAAQAAAALSEVSVEGAQNGLTAAQNNTLNTHRSSYTTVSGIVLNTLDIFYTDVQQNIVGVRIDTQGQAVSLSQRRVALEEELKNWQIDSNSITATSDLKRATNNAERITTEVRSLIDAFITLTNEANKNDTLDGQAVRSYTSTLNSERAVLNSVLANLESTLINLNNAEKALEQAKISSTNGSTLSTANAQVKQALGGLRAAEANYQKTIIRTPIAGTLNELGLKKGDFVSQYTQVALVANNNALEVTTYVGDFDLARIAVGQTVGLNNGVEGVVTAIAPAVDSATNKTEVKIGTESETIKTGDTVTITFSVNEESDDLDRPLLVPLTAIKFTMDDGYMFTVENGQLVSNPVEIGTINGSNVEIINGIDHETVFVIDARGLSAGEKVEVVNK